MAGPPATTSFFDRVIDTAGQTADAVIGTMNKTAQSVGNYANKMADNLKPIFDGMEKYGDFAEKAGYILYAVDPRSRAASRLIEGGSVASGIGEAGNATRAKVSNFKVPSAPTASELEQRGYAKYKADQEAASLKEYARQQREKEEEEERKKKQDAVRRKTKRPSPGSGRTPASKYRRL
jgi:hypothetical protein